MQTIGIIGLGLMGSALAERLQAGGYLVVGYDLSEVCWMNLKNKGGEPVQSACDVFTRCSCVLLSLPNSDVVNAVIQECWDLLSGKTIIDTTTGDPDATTELGRKLNQHGTHYLDATLTGSSQVARTGELVVTVGGPVELYRECESLFALFAKRWFHVGPWGSGARTKLVVNLVLGLNRAVLAEGLAFAKSCGLDQHAILEILKSGSAYSKVMDVKGCKMIEGDFSTEAKLSQHLKDVRLILDAGDDADVELPLSTVHQQLLSKLVSQGFGDEDNSAIIRAF